MDKVLKIALPIATILVSAATGIWNLVGAAPGWLSQLAITLAGVTGAAGLNNARRALNRTDAVMDDPYRNPPT